MMVLPSVASHVFQDCVAVNASYFWDTVRFTPMVRQVVRFSHEDHCHLHRL